MILLEVCIIGKKKYNWVGRIY